MSSLLTRVIYIFVAFAIVTAIGFSIPALVQNSTTVMADDDDFDDDDFDDDDENLCPCQLTEYFKLQTKFAKAFGIFDPDSLTCTDSSFGGDESTLLTADLDTGGFDRCQYGIRARTTTRSTGSTCFAKVFGEANCPFNVSYAIDELTDEELAACREAIIRVARSFEVPCP